MGIISKPREDLNTEGSPYSQKEELVKFKMRKSGTTCVISYFLNLCSSWNAAYAELKLNDVEHFWEQ